MERSRRDQHHDDGAECACAASARCEVECCAAVLETRVDGGRQIMHGQITADDMTDSCCGMALAAVACCAGGVHGAGGDVEILMRVAVSRVLVFLDMF